MSSQDDEKIDLKETGISTTEAMLQEKEDAEMNEDVFDDELVKEQMAEMPEDGDFEFTAANGNKYRLTLKEKIFCIAFLEEKGNGVEAVIKAGYEVRYKDNKGEYIPNAYNRKLAAVMAYQMLRKLHITSYINLKLAEYGFTDDHVDKQHLFLINQDADLKTKLGAIKEYNALKGRLAPKKLDLSTLGEKIIGIEMVIPHGADNTTTE